MSGPRRAKGVSRDKQGDLLSRRERNDKPYLGGHLRTREEEIRRFRALPFSRFRARWRTEEMLDNAEEAEAHERGKISPRVD